MSEIERAIEILPDGIIFYDDAECDGYCVADDCDIAAELLRGR